MFMTCERTYSRHHRIVRIKKKQIHFKTQYFARLDSKILPPTKGIQGIAQPWELLFKLSLQFVSYLRMLRNEAKIYSHFVLISQ